MSHAIVEAQIKKAAEFYQTSTLGYKATAEKFGLDWQVMRRAFLKMGVKPKARGTSRGKLIAQTTEVCCPSCGHTFPALEGIK